MRKKAGKAVIYFLVLMLCCTVVARAASSITVAKVKTAKVGKGVLTQTVTGSGTITAKEEYSQSLPEGQKIKEILVRPAFTLGVQWHPEALVGSEPSSLAVWQGFLRAAGR